MSIFEVLFQEWSILADLYDWKRAKGSKVSFYNQSTSFTMHLHNISSSWITPTENMVEKQTTACDKSYCCYFLNGFWDRPF